MISATLTSRRWWRQFTGSTIVTFGILASIPQLYLALWPEAAIPRGATLLFIATISIGTAIVRSYPQKVIDRDFDRPQVSVAVKVGDIFDETSHLVIGFNDVFDTDPSDELVISRQSVQGQFLDCVYAGDVERLDRDIKSALRGQQIVAQESRHDKPRGNLDRYTIGTVAVLGTPRRRFFCVAYGRMQNNLTVRSSVDDLWKSLDRLWECIDIAAHREPVAIPIIGSEMARINHLDREVLLRMILLSFMARSRQNLVSKKLTILIHPKDAHLVNMVEIGAFLRVL